MNNFTNKIFHENNLKLLKRMPDSFIDLVYCDILYGTGQDFGDYKDIKADRNIINEFYIPRFKEMHRVLKDAGSIYIQCDWRINHWIRLILDEIFGGNNFLNEIIWHYYNIAPSSKKFFAKNHDVILWFAKENKKQTFNLEELRIPYEKGSAYAKKGWSKNSKYAPNPKGKLMDDVWRIPTINNMAKERVGYPAQKPKALLERIIKASSNENDIIADFFCGSGTALVVAKELNRRYIGCDIEKKAVEITEKRLRNIKPTIWSLKNAK